MIRQMIELFQSHHDPARLRTVIAKQRGIIDRQRLEIAKLQHENRALRRRLGDAELRILRRAETDAMLIGGLHFAELPTSRRACQTMGIGSRRWMRAQALLRVGRVVVDVGIRAETPEDFERCVRVAGERIRRDGLETLRYRMPLCRQ